MCEFCGCEDGFQSVKVILPSGKEAKQDGQEVLVTENAEKGED